ncbi:hypothetical protein HPB49_011942 [Dermacentor silvarum]|uniref:Uncharacterized protein n=1 Tax=Dermacentor silvarum TaxID=543639 RepID=A0ACB8DZU5_DERSI|nr:hypothetical protein HPB49_011942 [Dermacentor silvarum]
MASDSSGFHQRSETRRRGRSGFKESAGLISTQHNGPCVSQARKPSCSLGPIRPLTEESSPSPLTPRPPLELVNNGSVVISHFSPLSHVHKASLLLTCLKQYCTGPKRERQILCLPRRMPSQPSFKVPGAMRVRTNLRGNVVAVDCLPTLIHATPCSLRNLRRDVKAKSAPKNVCTGVIFGVDTTFDCDTVIQNIASSAPIVACTRSGRNLVLKFAGSSPPPEVALFKQSRPVRPRRPRPLQCTNCRHVPATCTEQSRCLRCGDTHSTADCKAPNPSASTVVAVTLPPPRCPRWQHERKVAEIKAASPHPSLVVRPSEKPGIKNLYSPTARVSRPNAHVQPGRTQPSTRQPTCPPPVSRPHSAVNTD